MDLSTLLCALPATDSSTWGRYIRINAVATVEEGREIFRTHVLHLSETAEIDLPIAIMHNWSTGEGINVDTDDFLPADHLLCFDSERWHSLPSQVWITICKLTGAQPPPKARLAGTAKTVDMTHLLDAYPRPSEIFHWMFAKAEEFGHQVKPGDDLVFHGIRAESLYFQSDHKRTDGPPRGELDPAITVHVSDVHAIPPGNGLAAGYVFFSPPYEYNVNYVNDIPGEHLERLYYNQSINLRGSISTIGQHLRIFPKSAMRPLSIITGHQCNGDGAPASGPEPVLMGGPKMDTVLRVGMGVTFKLEPQAVPEELAVLQGLVVSVNQPQLCICVRLALTYQNLPAYMRFDRLGLDQVLQTCLELWVKPEDVLAVHRIMPNALHQHGGYLRTSPHGSFDLVVVGHLKFSTEPKIGAQESPRNTATLGVLNAMHGIGDDPVQMELHRVACFATKKALGVIAGNARLFGLSRPGYGPHLSHISWALWNFALGKTRVTNNTTVDNTLHIQMCGNMLACMLLDLVPWGPGLEMEKAVSLQEGVLMVELPSFQSAAGLLQRDNGLFDFTSYRKGFVELYSPIVFKWEMYDTTRSAETSRSVDGFVAITFASYSERNADNNFEIKGTRENDSSARQLRQRPSKCPRC